MKYITLIIDKLTFLHYTLSAFKVSEHDGSSHELQGIDRYHENKR
jgi:hypothetical protein